MATRRKSTPASAAMVAAEAVAQGRVEDATKGRLDQHPHLPPRPRFSDDPAQTDRLPALLATARQRALTEAAARPKLRHLLSIDADFDVYRDRAGRPLVNLLRR